MLGIIPVLLAVCIVVYVLVRQAARRGDAPDGGCCGRCGYSARGLSSFTCPECGSDLREVGIYVPSMTGHLRRRPSLARNVTTWTVMLAIFAIAISFLVHRYCLPTIRSAGGDYCLLWPASGQYKQVAFHSHGYSVDWPYRQPQRSLAFDGVDVTLTGNDGRTISLQATFNQYGYDYVNAEGRRVFEPAGLTCATILDWMRSAGIDVTRTDVRAEVDEITKVIQDYSTAGAPQPLPRASAFGGRSSGTNTFCGPPRIAKPLTVFVWLAIWLLGIWRILRSWRFAQNPKETAAGKTVVETGPRMQP